MYCNKIVSFFLLYDRHLFLPINIIYDLVELQEADDKPYNPYELDMFQAVFQSALSLSKTTHDHESVNIKNVQVKQQKHYKRRHQSMYSQLNIDDKVLLQKNTPGQKSWRIDI